MAGRSAQENPMYQEKYEREVGEKKKAPAKTTPAKTVSTAGAADPKSIKPAAKKKP